ncbi:RHO4 protein [Umbelopsis nana]
MSSTAKSQQEHVPRVKLVIVGDGACGKTSLLHVLKYGTFSKIPTVFDTYVHTVQVDGKTVELALWDTAGQEEYELIRIHSYSGANVILISFAIDTTDSLENVTSEWIEEVNKECPNVPIILVGLKKDLRPQEMQPNDNLFVHPREAEIVKSNIGARDYIECSALTGEGVQKVFDIATRAGLIQKQKHSSKCCIIL